MIIDLLDAVDPDRDHVHGQRSTALRSPISLAAVAAVGLAGTPTEHGWGVVMSTDTALALGLAR